MPDPLPPTQAPTALSPETPTITAEDKENFFRAFLSGLPYTEDVTLFDGKLRLTLKGLSVEENDDVLRQISADIKQGVAANDDAYFLRILKYRLALSLTKLDGKEFSDVVKILFVGDAAKGESYVASRAAAFNSWPVFKLAGVNNAFKKFEDKLLHLVTKVDEPSFWIAAAPSC